MLLPARTFLENKSNILGAKPDKWKITRLIEGAQFYERGVRKGWRVIKVNDIEVNEKNKGSFFFVTSTLQFVAEVEMT